MKDSRAQQTLPHCPRVHNALLRCTRADDKAASLFERIEKEPGLWVLELEPLDDDSWDGWLAQVQEMFTQHEALLSSLGTGSADYTLHVVVQFCGGLQAVRVPPSLSRVLAACAIVLEIYDVGY